MHYPKFPVAVWTAVHTVQFLTGLRGEALYPLWHLVAMLVLRRRCARPT